MLCKANSSISYNELSLHSVDSILEQCTRKATSKVCYINFFVNKVYTRFSMFCIHQDSEVDSLAEVTEEVGNFIIPVPSCIDCVFIARSKAYKTAWRRNTLNSDLRSTTRLQSVTLMQQQQSITMETEILVKSIGN